MEKSIFKKCLQILDRIETNQMNPKTLLETLFLMANVERISVSQDEINDLLDFLFQTNNLYYVENFYDLSQPLTLFSRSRHHSTLEALSLFEAMIQTEDSYTYMKSHLNDTFSMNEFHPFFNSIIKDTELFIHDMIHPSLLSECTWILEDVLNHYNCSYALKTHYTNDLYAHTKLLFKNEQVPMIAYPHSNEMKKIYANAGIPIDRDCSKDLQVFFKDCLFNEFKHQCCICGIDLPHMLIASHIKPFRDCGYLVEAMDSNNGLLLCRNHDYLFDQGYISFDNQGNILLSNDIKKEAHKFGLTNDFQLNASYLTITRKLFIEYHRKHIFQK